MLTFIILGALSVIIGVWALNKGSKTTTTTPVVETKEEEPVGYESGSFASIATEEPAPVVAPKPKKKSAPKTPKTDAKPKTTKTKK